MSVSTPLTSIAHDVPTRTNGRRLNVDVESDTPLGRQLHALEGLAFTGSQQAVYYRSDRDSRLIHDTQADHHVYEIERAALTLLAWPDLTAEVRNIVHGILSDVQGYWRADEAEDAAAVTGDVRVEAMHGGFKRIAGWAEKVCTAIRKAARS